MSTVLHLIDQWNSSRLELFKISSPDKNSKFTGVMRFFYETNDKFHTKCLRVSNEMRVKDLIPILMEKFFISVDETPERRYKLYERANSIDKLLGPEESPLLLQLMWCRDDREGLFVLRADTIGKVGRRQRTNSKKEKLGSRSCLNSPSNRCLDKFCRENPSKSSKRLSKSSSFMSTPSFLSRTISNPESLMRMKRKSKLEEKLKEISESGNINAGGTLKIYGESLNPLIPYKSLLLSINDTAEFVIREILDKYSLEKEDEKDYCLVKCVYKEPNSQKVEYEVILKKWESPLQILLQSNKNAEFTRFKVIKCPPDLLKSKKIRNRYPSPDFSKENLVKKSIIKKSESVNYKKGEIQYHSRHRFDERLIQLHQNDFINNNNNESSNKIYSSPPQSDSSLNLEKRIEPEKKPLPSYEESMSALRGWHIKQTKSSGELKPFTYRGSTDSFSLSSDYLEGSSYNTDSYESQNLPSIEMNDREDDDAVIISDLDSHLSRHLPVQITYFKSKEDMLLDSIILDIKPLQIKFKLASAYVLHLMVVDIIRLTCINRATAVDQELIIGLFIDKVASKTRQSIMQHRTIIPIQAYWLANCTEFLHLLKNNILLSRFNSSYFEKYYELFADNAQWCFQCISFGFTDDMVNTLPVLLNEDADDPSDRDDCPLSRKVAEPKHMSDLIRTLSSCMAVLQHSHVNAALIIQIFSRIFHLINCWIFNSFLENPTRITRGWARIVMIRIDRIRYWSERHELLLAADCYFQQTLQMCKLLLMEKTDIELLYNESVDMVDINSIQLRYLLENYVYSPNEARVPQIWIDFVVSGANQVADKVFEEEGIEISLKENESLNLPLLLPEDGYHVDSLYGGIPVGFIEYLEKLHKEWCFYKICHQDIHFDWLCQKKIYNETFVEPVSSKEPALESHVYKSQNTNNTHSMSRHQLKLSDFKANIYYENLDNINNNESVVESGIDTYRNPSFCQSVCNVEDPNTKLRDLKSLSKNQFFENGNVDPTFDVNLPLVKNHFSKPFSDTCSTTATSFISEMIDDDPCSSHSAIGKKSKEIGINKKSSELDFVWKVVAQEQLQSVIKDVDSIYSKKLYQRSNECERPESEDLIDAEYSQTSFLNSVSQTNDDFSTDIKPSEVELATMKNICEFESQMKLVDTYSLLKSNSLPIRASNGGSQPPVSFVPASYAMRNTLNYPPRTKPKPRINHLSNSNRSNSAANIFKSDSSFEIPVVIQPRSLSSDRFNSRMSDGMENLSFQEKVQLFEFAISRSSH